MPWMRRFKRDYRVKLSMDLDFAKVLMEAAAENFEEVVRVQSRVKREMADW
jgi:hypothetical protein